MQSSASHRDDSPWSVRMADSMLRRYESGRTHAAQMRWCYEDGFLLRAVEQVGLQTREAQSHRDGSRYWQAVVDYADRFIDPSGKIRTYEVADYNLDQVMPGRLLFPVYQATGEERYRKAIYLLVEQLRGQPRTQAGGFWHKLIYPYQMWLDGIYMACPFYAQYAATFPTSFFPAPQGGVPCPLRGRSFRLWDWEPSPWDDVVHQIITIEQCTRDPVTGLLYHAWDESRQQRWADPNTGRSPHFWCRAMGWYVMALVDVLDYLPADHPGYASIVGLLEAALKALLAVQDPATGLWRQVLDQGGRPGNYLEASGACMYVYAMAKGVRTGRLPGSWLQVAARSYQQIIGHFVEVDAQGETHLHGTCAVAGLGGDPYRDASYEYYVSERVVTNEPKGAAAFILAAVEMERAQEG